MKKHLALLFIPSIILLIALVQLVVVQDDAVTPNVASVSTNRVRTIPTPTSTETGQALAPFAQQAKQLVDAYSDQVMIDPEEGNVIIWKEDTTRMRFDDGVPGKELADMLDQPDLQDQMSMPYTPGEEFTIARDQDPGRVRFEPFFKKMYGSTPAEVKANLTTIYWLPSSSNRPLRVTRVNGVNQKLQAVSSELDRLVQQPGKHHLLTYLQDPGGTFRWRNIAGTDRLSAHSFGIAIDINSAHGDYWRWSETGTSDYQNSIPMEIVEVFEKHGFIWGGKWYHFDTMHFEYRPELLPGQW